MVGLLVLFVLEQRLYVPEYLRWNQDVATQLEGEGDGKRATDNRHQDDQQANEAGLHQRIENGLISYRPVLGKSQVTDQHERAES